jgi:hypothetical protein
MTDVTSTLTKEIAFMYLVLKQTKQPNKITQNPQNIVILIKRVHKRLCSDSVLMLSKNILRDSAAKPI